jgi:hypothetical protein
MVLYIMAAKLSTMPRSELEEFITSLRLLSQKVQKILDEEDEMDEWLECGQVESMCEMCDHYLGPLKK